MTLDEAVSQMVNLGHKDPLEIARKILEKNDKQWIATELTALAEDVIAGMARHVLGSQRRGSEIALRTGDSGVSASDLKLRSYWVPEVGYKRAADLTSADLRLRAGWYDKLMTAAARRAEWCRTVAEMMDDEGAATMGKLKKDLPALPADEDLAELPVAV